MGTSVGMAGGSLADDGGSHEAARVGQSSSAHRLIAAPHEHAIHAVAVEAAVQVAAALVLLEEGIQRVDQRHPIRRNGHLGGGRLAGV